MKKIIALIFTSLILLTACKQDNFMQEYPNFKKKDHHFIQESLDETLTKLENKEAGTYFIGYPECPYCADFVLVLEDLLTELDQEVYYINRQSNDFNGKNAQRFAEFDQTLLPGQQSEGAVPFLIQIDSDQKIRTHIGTFAGHQPGLKLTEDQEQYFKIKLKQTILGQ